MSVCGGKGVPDNAKVREKGKKKKSTSKAISQK